LPARRAPPPPQGLRLVGLHLARLLTLGSRQLRRRPPARSTLLPRPARPRRPLGARALALLTGRHALRHDSPREPRHRITARDAIARPATAAGRCMPRP